jgi:hypothetical protein
MSPLHSVIYKKLYLLILFINKKKNIQEREIISTIFTEMLIVIVL